MTPMYVPIFLFAVLGIAFVTVTLLASSVLRPHDPKPEKLTTYECGERPVGQAWSQFNVRFYIFALMFVIFDVETVFVFPWAAGLRNFTNMGLGPFMFVEMVIFLLILVLGLVYAWRKGVLQWT